MAKGKPIIAVLDPDSASGHMSVSEVRQALVESESNFENWGMGGDEGPSGEQCIDALFSQDPIEWNRIGAFQDVTLRLIAERVLPPEHGLTYLSGELVHHIVSLPPPRTGPLALPVRIEWLAVFTYSLLTTHHSPLTTHHSPLTAHHSPRTTHCSLLSLLSLLTAHHSLLTTHYSLRTSHVLLLSTYYLLRRLQIPSICLPK